VHEVLSTFADESKQLITPLIAAFSEGDLVAQKAVAHRFKGCCLAVGASELAANLQRIETADGAELEGLEPEIRAAYDRLCQTVTRHLRAAAA
jgi:HPt (histidine-containing phosphotransfer) domain-containing protein